MISDETRMIPRFSPSRPRRILTLGALVLLPLFSSGCGLFFQHTLRYDDFSLHGDHSKEDLARTGDTIQQVFDAYRVLFPAFEERVDDARVLYAEEALSREKIYTGDLRQEGYYLPVFDLIRLSPRRPRGDADDLSVILHETGHHFLISAFPKTSSQYWLNEGLCCCLEVSYFDEEGVLQTPLFHPTLFPQARRILRRRGSTEFRTAALEVIDANWFQFHQSNQNNDHYAYSWSIFWHLLRHTSGTLEERVLKIIELPLDDVRASLDGVIADLRLSADTHLARLAANPELRSWCLDQWASLPYADGNRFRRALMAEIDPENDPDAESWRRVTLLINGRVRGLSRTGRQRIHNRIANTLGSEETAEETRIAIAEALSEDGSRSWAYIGPLIDGLESPSPELRAVCARALARLSRQKPTVVNPDFWRNASAEARQGEIDEWRAWINRRR